jgi:bis(5'-nucleosyl)-tetraphosphatase (symmetrical)
MDFLIGDVQGCSDALDRLLAEIGYSPSRDQLCVLGDLVNRGPGSLPTLRRLRGFGSSALCLLGNHDLHLLAVSQGIRKPHRGDTLNAILDAPDRADWLAWLRERSLAERFGGWLCVHAGVVPEWSPTDVLQLAGEVQTELRSSHWAEFLAVMYGNQPDRWDPGLHGHDRLRFVVNVLTRIRFIDAKGRLDLKAKGDAEEAPPGCTPWFDAPGRRTAGTPIACGHWSTLGLLQRPDLLAIDTGCVWGGQLTAVRVDGSRREVHQVRCDEACTPG